MDNGQNINVFNELNKLDVNDKVEKKSNLTYLSWAWAWAKVKGKFPGATYKVWKDESGNPYTFDATLGYMCYTTVTIEGETLEMWLPVMNGANKAMTDELYTYKVKGWQGKPDTEKTVEAATMFDINKTIMRCLVKNLAMFGLGLYIYAGEDLPEQEQPTKESITDLINHAKKAADLSVIKGWIQHFDLTDAAMAKLETFETK